MRLLLASLSGVAVAAASAVVLGDYPLSGPVPWAAAVLVPLLIGTAMSLVAGARKAALWICTGPLSLLSVGWGVRIATGWGLDPVPASCWAAMALVLVWPPAWGLIRRSPGGAGSVDGQLGDLRHAGGAEVGDP